MTIRARAPGKVMLFGEYAVLEGATARVVAVETWARASAAPTGGASTYRIHDEAVDEPGPFVRAALEAVGPVPSAAWTFESRSFSTPPGAAPPMKLGLGSSAAITVAAVGVARALSGVSARPRDVLQPALLAHRSAQGERGSGADIAASTLGGLVECAFFEQAAWAPSGAIRVGPGALAVAQRPVPSILSQLTLVFAGASASTPALVRAVMEQRHARPIVWDRALSCIADASDVAAVALEADDRNALAEAVRAGDQAMTWLSRELGGGTTLLGPLHAALQGLVGPRCALKTTGAGGGDLYWLYGETEADEREAAERVRAAGHHVLTVHVEHEGFVVEAPGAT